MQTKISYSVTLKRSHNYQSAEISMGVEALLDASDDVEQAKRELQASLNAEVKKKSDAALRYLVNEADKFERERVALLRERNEAAVAASRARNK